MLIAFGLLFLIILLIAWTITILNAKSDRFNLWLCTSKHAPNFPIIIPAWIICGLSLLPVFPIVLFLIYDEDKKVIKESICSHIDSHLI